MSALPLATPLPGEVLDGTRQTLRIAEASLSPSLGGRQRGNSAAFEVKFLLTETEAVQVEQTMQSQMRLDPYADPRTGNAYQITSTYLDTPRLDVFHRIGRHRLRKFRLRRYGDTTWSYLERKTKRKDQVRKHRSKADNTLLPLLAAPLVVEPWDGAWFHRQVTRWSLAPTCQLTYLRRAYFGESEASPIRLTFDRELRAKRLSGWERGENTEYQDILGAMVICEFKFRGAMPECFKQVISEMSLAPRGASKYRRSMTVLGEAQGVARSNAHG